MDKTTNITLEFTPEYFNQELKGISDASGVDFKMMQQIHMLGELTKGKAFNRKCTKKSEVYYVKLEKVHAR